MLLLILKAQMYVKHGDFWTVVWGTWNKEPRTKMPRSKERMQKNTNPCGAKNKYKRNTKNKGISLPQI